jgi:hypothetical protein
MATRIIWNKEGQSDEEQCMVMSFINYSVCWSVCVEWCKGGINEWDLQDKCEKWRYVSILVRKSEGKRSFGSCKR